MRDILAAAARDAGETWHACVTDPPYHLTSIQKRFGREGSAPAQYGRDGAFSRLSGGFMGKAWDGGDVAFRPGTWRLVYDVLRPGAWLEAFGGTRTQHRMTCAIEDAGFEIRDQLCWMYATGFPKSHNVSKHLDKAAGVERGAEGYIPNYANSVMGRGFGGGHKTHREAPVSDAARTWEGYGTALKPASEPIILARKPLDGTVAENALTHGCGGIDIDGCRVQMEEGRAEYIVERLRGFRNARSTGGNTAYRGGRIGAADDYDPTKGRWPPNILHDGSPEVLEAFARFGDRPGQLARARTDGAEQTGVALGAKRAVSTNPDPRADLGTAARFFPSLGFDEDDLRFFCCAKASRAERAGSKHPTVKPLALMRWLVKLVTPPGGRVLDPFAGTGTTLVASRDLGIEATGIEMTDEYIADIRRRLGLQDLPEILRSAELGREAFPDALAAP